MTNPLTTIMMVIAFLFQGSAGSADAVEETFETRAQRALEAMKKAAGEQKIHGAAVISYLPKGAKSPRWSSKMLVVGKMHNGAKNNAKGYNYLAIAYAKSCEMVRTLKDSGTSGAKHYVGETGWKGGCIVETVNGYVIAAFSGGPSEKDYIVAKAGVDAYQKGKAVSLFNGKNLDGWTIACMERDRGKNYWTVQDGAIVLDTKGDKKHDYMWLLSDKEFADFELTMSFKVLRESGGNTGLQIRSRYLNEPTKGKWMHGPQIDIHPPTPFRTGLIYDETISNQRWIFPSLKNWAIQPDQASHKVKWNNGWNKLVIRAKGTQIRTWLNGFPVANYDGKGILDDAEHQKYRVGMKGHLALQLHNRDDIAIAFKDLMIRELGN